MDMIKTASFRSIERISDIKTAMLVYPSLEYNCGQEGFVDGVLDPSCAVIRHHNLDEAIGIDGSIDIVFLIAAPEKLGTPHFLFCQRLRASGYDGIIVAVINEKLEIGSTPFITSKGFDHYLTLKDDKTGLIDSIQWAILNRRRRNKFSLQFDHNPDSFYTLDVDGKVYDLNQEGAKGSSYTPKDIVNMGIHISEIPNLKCFNNIIRPLINLDNVNQVFSNTIDDGDNINQITTKIHNVPTIGLVATVVKTDITRSMYSKTMDILINSITLLSQRDNYTASHSSRVFYYCYYIAEEMGLIREKSFARNLFIAALLHDVGKIGVRDHILLKPGKLDHEEFESLSSHPVKGHELLRNYSFLKSAAEIVRSHHERPDGKGYPDRLTEGDTPLEAYIIAVADSFDAMTTCRPYRDALAYDKAVSEIGRCLGSQYQGDIGNTFLKIISPGLLAEVHSNAEKSLSEISQEIIFNLLN